MKNLISLLSVLTIGGTAVPTTIAASPYQKEDKKLNNNVDLETLNRTKRSPQYNLVTGQGGGQQQIYNPQTGGLGQPTYQQPQWGQLAPSIPNQNSNLAIPILLQSGRSFSINNDKFYYIGPSTGLLYFHEHGSASINRIIQIGSKKKVEVLV